MATRRWLALVVTALGCGTVENHRAETTSSPIVAAAPDPLSVAAAAKASASPDPEAKCLPAPKPTVRLEAASKLSPFARPEGRPADKLATKGTSPFVAASIPVRPMTDKQLAAERDFKARVAALNARLSPSDKTYQGEYAKAKAEALAKAE